MEPLTILSSLGGASGGVAALDTLAASTPSVGYQALGTSLLNTIPMSSAGYSPLSEQLAKEQFEWDAAPDAKKDELARGQLMKDLEKANLAARADIAASTSAPLVTAPAPGIVPLGGGRKLQRK